MKAILLFSIFSLHTFFMANVHGTVFSVVANLVNASTMVFTWWISSHFNFQGELQVDLTCYEGSPWQWLVCIAKMYLFLITLSLTVKNGNVTKCQNGQINLSNFSFHPFFVIVFCLLWKKEKRWLSQSHSMYKYLTRFHWLSLLEKTGLENRCWLEVSFS